MSGKKLHVLVVWEPMLPTDWRKPTTGTLSRISDARAAQFWDPDHLVAHEIERDDPPPSVLRKPQCCEDDHTYWDMAIIYANGKAWSANAPAPLFRDGPIYKVWPQVETNLIAIAQ
ncbi:MAG TPA: hypothetical protein VJN21_07485 [Candidatus Acidoferrales bacterium]|nr:hypothetical protein [Candidatus Acidoferrales bacterium]